MGYTGQIHNFLYAAGGEHGKAGLAAIHYIAVVTKNGHSMSANGAGGHVDNSGLASATDTVHDRDHQHQSLRGGKRGGKRARLQRAVDRTNSARLRLHLHKIDRLSKQILASVGGPLICFFRHRRGRGDGINCRHFRKRISHIGSRFVAVHNHKFLFAHISTLLFLYSVSNHIIAYNS